MSGHKAVRWWWAGRAVALALAAAAAGCAVVEVKEFDPAWFARDPLASQSALPGRAAVLVPPQVASLVVHSERLRSAGNATVSVPIGRIVEQAATLALQDALRGGVQGVETPVVAEGDAEFTVVIDATRFEIRDELNGVIPLFLPLLPWIEQRELVTLLAIDLRLLDARGRVLWSRTYDAGREIVKPVQGRPESVLQSLVRQAHEAAWRLLAGELVRDLRLWRQAERMKPREL